MQPAAGPFPLSVAGALFLALLIVFGMIYREGREEALAGKTAAAGITAAGAPAGVLPKARLCSPVPAAAVRVAEGVSRPYSDLSSPAGRTWWNFREARASSMEGTVWYQHTPEI